MEPAKCRGLMRVFVALVLLCRTSPAQLHPDGYRVVRAYPHDSRAFTQGLVYVNGVLYESTGLNGRSSLRAVDVKTGAIRQQVAVPERYFAEGLTEWHDQLIQLTWMSHIAFVYDRLSFQLISTFHFTGEGWGLTRDGHDLILSDGTSTLRFLDPRDFHEVRRTTVTENGKPITDLNELEYIHRQIYANVWHSDRILRISPETGHVLGWLDFGNLLSVVQRSDPEAVLNGIAWDPTTDHLFVTGKLWPQLFEIEVLSRDKPTPRKR